MGNLLQRFLRVLSSASSADAERGHQHVTATLGCCSNIRIEEHEEQENTHAPSKDDDTYDSGNLGGQSDAFVGN